MKIMQTQYRYMHTINGHPADFDDQIHYARKTQPINTLPDLDAIKQQQRASRKWRKSKGFQCVNDYGWVKISAGPFLNKTPKEKP